MTADANHQELLDRAVTLCRDQPENVENLYALTELLCRAGELPTAYSTLESFLPLHGNQAGLHEWLGRVAFLSNQYKQSLPHLKQALQLEAKRPLALKMLGLAYFQLGNFAAAVPVLKEFLVVNPGDGQAQGCLGIALVQGARVDEGLEILTNAADNNRNDPAMSTNVGDTLKVMGRLEEAAAWYRRAIAVEPKYGQAHAGLLSIQRFDATGHPDLLQAEKALGHKELSPHDKASLHFALGKAYDDCRAYDRAFAQFKLGNEIRKKQLKPFNYEVYGRYFQQIADLFQREFFSNNKITGSQSQRPVFIVGMPRSGTSLMEQIISGHPKVFGAGELLWLSRTAAQLPERFDLGGAQYPQSVTRLTLPMVRELADEFERELLSFAGSDAYDRISDKMPHNYLYLGLVAVLFPNARVIHCRRDPMDSCLSNYFQDFTTHLSYSNDLADLGSYYRLYDRLMAHWRKHLPLAMYEVDYERLVADPEAESRKVLKFLDLPWDAACLETQARQRSVNTASSWQVRQKIHTGSRERWRNYHSHLTPLIRNLQDG